MKVLAIVQARMGSTRLPNKVMKLITGVPMIELLLARLAKAKEVDQIIFPGPLVITKEFVDKHKIDIIVHGFADTTDLNKQMSFFENVRDKFEMLPYYTPISTSKLLKDIKER